MPMRTLKELLSCRVKARSPLSEAVVAEHFRRHGGVARQAFFKGNETVLQSRLESALKKFQEKPQDVLGSVSGADTQEVSNELLHYRVDEDAFMTNSTIFESGYIGDRMCDLNLQVVVDRIAVLQTSKQESGLRGRLFERFAHRVLSLGSKAFGAMPLMMSPFADCKPFKIPEVTSLKVISRFGDLEVFSPSDIGAYLRPEVPNFPVVDSLLTPHTGYQITVSSTHEINFESFPKLLRSALLHKESEVQPRLGRAC